MLIQLIFIEPFVLVVFTHTYTPFHFKLFWRTECINTYIYAYIHIFIYFCISTYVYICLCEKENQKEVRIIMITYRKTEGTGQDKDQRRPSFLDPCKICYMFTKYLLVSLVDVHMLLGKGSFQKSSLSLLLEFGLVYWITLISTGYKQNQM